MKNIRLFPANCICFLLILFCFGCTSEQSLVLSESCFAPCWFDITLGKTQKDDLFQLAKNNLKDNIVKIEEDEDGWNIFDYILYLDLIPNDEVQIYTIDGIVAQISFKNSKGISSVEKLIDNYGKPKFIARSKVLGPGPFYLPASSADHEWFFMIYPEKGVILGYDTYHYGKNLRPETRITNIEYFDSGKFDTLLKKGFLVYSTTGYSEDLYYRWGGYGEIDDLFH
jgi:hypothetical protein